jgi:hypothetical protein
MTRRFISYARRLAACTRGRREAGRYVKACDRLRREGASVSEIPLSSAATHGSSRFKWP